MKFEDRRVKVKKGQVWRKRDTGHLIQITGRKNKAYYTTKRLDGHRSHSVYEKDLWLWWDLVR
jgi:hypothetical protein